jgi:hypothetical protein
MCKTDRSGKDAVARNQDERPIIEAASPKSLMAILSALSPLAQRFPDIPDLGIDTFDL